MDGFEILYKLLILIKVDSTIKDAKKLIEQLTDIKVEDQRFKFTLNFDSQMNDEDLFYKCLNCYIEDISYYPVKLKRNFYNKYINLDLNENIEQLKNRFLKKKKFLLKDRNIIYIVKKMYIQKNLKIIKL